MPLVPAPKPGIYPNVPFEKYVEWNAFNHSRLKPLIKGCSMRSFKRGRTDQDTPAKVFGRAGHMAFLEPDRFAAAVALAPINPTTQKAYGYDTKKYMEACAAQPGKVLLSEEDIEGCKLLVKNIREHPVARDVFERKGMAEVCIVWTCPITGLLCKGRIDYLNNYSVDVKTTECAAEEALSSDIVKFFYHTQDAFYDIGRRTLGIDASHTLAFVEKETWDVAMHCIDEPTVAIAETLVKEALNKIAACQRAEAAAKDVAGKEQAWPGYTQHGIQPIGAPLWYLKKFADAEV